MGKKNDKGKGKKKGSPREQTPTEEKKTKKRQRTNGSSSRPPADVLKVVPRKMLFWLGRPFGRFPALPETAPATLPPTQLNSTSEMVQQDMVPDAGPWSTQQEVADLAFTRAERYDDRGGAQEGSASFRRTTAVQLHQTPRSPYNEHLGATNPLQDDSQYPPTDSNLYLPIASLSGPLPGRARQPARSSPQSRYEPYPRSSPRWSVQQLYNVYPELGGSPSGGAAHQRLADHRQAPVPYPLPPPPVHGAADYSSWPGTSYAETSDSGYPFYMMPQLDLSVAALPLYGPQQGALHMDPLGIPSSTPSYEAPPMQQNALAGPSQVAQNQYLLNEDDPYHPEHAQPQWGVPHNGYWDGHGGTSSVPEAAAAQSETPDDQPSDERPRIPDDSADRQGDVDTGSEYIFWY
ncbi:hypothetical protein BD311DRAFT_216839 [Dichomitus squalens]|uniref:Uncharacterized protein n=1 Tax=Dichomitus squalens TaxID=114155 RepID=A0A4Q9MVK7_9APHY|nr:hypothetical protein BD311DRAFT_216839 [Dichomitus squalens]